MTNKNPLTKDKILKLLRKDIKLKLGTELINLEKSLNRFLAKDLVSKLYLPPFNNSAVDGYALLKSNLNNNSNILINNKRIVAGDKQNIYLKKNIVSRIFTGAKMPLNSKTVVMQENVKLFNNKLKINKLPKYGENCRLKGEDIKKGQKILKKGEKIKVKNINLIAAIGKKKIIVNKKIKIGYYTSGNELQKPTENLKGSEINNSNFYSLHALLNQAYIKQKFLGNLKDNKKLVINSLLKNTKKFDIIITTGGASVGEEDHLIDAVNQIGKVYFWKTAIKPGRPLAIGKINKTIIICLPGNPVSVHLLYGMLIKPLIEYICSGKFNLPKSTKVKVNFFMKKKNKRLEWLRVMVQKNKDELIVNKFPKQGSGMISSIAYSDGIIEIPEKVSFISKGEYYSFYSYEDIFD
ncbi:molybdopterin molybdotransferase MoeA [Alphaproteobacteria bacterium]|nr:molybdopterin molybdotransferase MoeA [Alphaproteobacteria bacterium]